eukprot:12754059-Ditylum_brightwellii.AAC.1
MAAADKQQFNSDMQRYNSERGMLQEVQGFIRTYVGRWGVFLEFYNMTSWYDYLGRVGILGTWVWKLVDVLWKFESQRYVQPWLVSLRVSLLGCDLGECVR